MSENLTLEIGKTGELRGRGLRSRPKALVTKHKKQFLCGMTNHHGMVKRLKIML